MVSVTVKGKWEERAAEEKEPQTKERLNKYSFHQASLFTVETVTLRAQVLCDIRGGR